MAKRFPVSGLQNIWFDSQQVDNTDLSAEQIYNDTVNSDFIGNHIGSGILPENLVPNVIFDSDGYGYQYLDGLALYPTSQPRDAELGNQLEVSLLNSKASGRKTVKVAIFGQDFAGELQYETFVFRKNEAQISYKHFSKVYLILINDVDGNPNKSLNLGGKVIIAEARPFALSRDCMMASQDKQPNLFFRDFWLDSNLSFFIFLRNALAQYNANVDEFGITSNEIDTKIIAPNDVVTQIGQKFKATTNNIQKVTLLLSSTDSVNPTNTNPVWDGDIVVSIYQLQTSVDNFTDVPPNTEIEYSPSNIPLAQISFNYSTLLNTGVKLDNNPQPVDFVFSNTGIANGAIKVGAYYCVTLKRSGSSTLGNIHISTGTSLDATQRLTIFSGNLWVDDSESSLWFQVWTDSVKLSDGQGYENGFGVNIPKTTTLNGLTVDNIKKDYYFYGSNPYNAVLFANLESSTPVQDQRTGNPVYSRQQHVPDIKLLNDNELSQLLEPTIIGNVADKNLKASDGYDLVCSIKNYSFIGDEIYIRFVEDPLDINYNVSDYQQLSLLLSYIASGSIINAKFFPNNLDNSIYYRITAAETFEMIQGDVNGDGLIDLNDIAEIDYITGFNLVQSPPVYSSITIVPGFPDTVTVVNGYEFLSKSSVDSTLVSFHVVNGTASEASSGDGILTTSANEYEYTFTSTLVNFSLISSISTKKLVIHNSANASNNGSYRILSRTGNTLLLRKVLYNADNILKCFRSDFTYDYVIDSTDTSILTNYVNKVPFSPTFTPPINNPYEKIGKNFRVIKLKFEKFEDRTDDYYVDLANRANGSSVSIHTPPDMLKEVSVYQSRDFLVTPGAFKLTKLVGWDSSLVLVKYDTKYISTIFSSLIQAPNPRDGLGNEVYPQLTSAFNNSVDHFIPGNLILGGEVVRPLGERHKLDFEMATLVLQIPEELKAMERTVNIFDAFVADYENNGLTRLGYPALRFSDGTFVKTDALSLNQVRFSVSVQSFSPNFTPPSVWDPTMDGKIGVFMNYQTGDITLDFTNLLIDPGNKTLDTKIQVAIYLKKAGFNNRELFVRSEEMTNLLGL